MGMPGARPRRPYRLSAMDLRDPCAERRPVQGWQGDDLDALARQPRPAPSAPPGRWRAPSPPPLSQLRLCAARRALPDGRAAPAAAAPCQQITRDAALRPALLVDAAAMTAVTALRRGAARRLAIVGIAEDLGQRR